MLGLAAYAAINWFMERDDRIALVPVSLLLGSFLIPFVVVMFLQESDAGADLPPEAPTIAFAAGGLLGLLGAHLLTPLFFRLPGSRVLMIGTSEELAKLVAVLAVLLLPVGRRTPATARAGLVLGASAGLGFAALESMGMGFRFLIESGFSRSLMERILVARSLFGPLAHGVWSAILASAVWPLREDRSPRALLRAAGALAAASVLHALWNLPRLLPEETNRAMMTTLVPFLPLPIWHVTVAVLSLFVLFLFARGRWAGSPPPSPDEVKVELEACRALAEGLEIAPR